MKVSKNSKYQTHEKPKRRNWHASEKFGFKIFRKKSHNAEKTERGDPLVSPGTVCYAEKEEKPDDVIYCPPPRVHLEYPPNTKTNFVLE